MRTGRTPGTATHAREAAAAPLRRVDALDARVKSLREEARTGLASSEVRRTLIKEQLRPPPRPIPAPPMPSRRTAQPHIGLLPSASKVGSSLGSSTALPIAHHPSIHVETAGDDELPEAWLIGAFQLDAPPETSTSDARVSSSSTAPSPAAPAASAPATRAQERGVDVSYANALRAYEALCRAAQDVAYNVAYEEGLRRVDTRDGITGLATSWISRRVTAPLGSSDTLIFSGGSVAPVEEPRAGSSYSDTSTQRTTSLALYSPPSSSHGAADAFSASPARSSLYSSHSQQSQRSSLSVRQPRSASTLAPPVIATSTVGTAVVRSSAANFVTSLRRVVKAQREQGAAANQSGRLNQLCFPLSTAVEDEREPEWRTCVAAALTIAVCSSCNAMLEYALDAKSMSGVESNEGKEAEVEGGDEKTAAPGSTTVCPRCGAAVEAAATTAAATAACRWLPPPQAPAAGSDAAALPDSLHRSAKKESNMEVPHSSAVQCSVKNGEPRSNGCGTDSAGFALGDGEESFAALVAGIRASKRRAEAHTQSASTTHATLSTPTAMDAATVKPPESRHRGPVGSASGGTAPSQPPHSLPLSTLPVPAPVDPMALRLRAALRHPYFFELRRGGADRNGNT
ncbi:hypothetical protein ABL78_6082 [Leptomonas seymouri]|uniref:Uncharacterized protein n=1 Tax=Leptomonas seymouri TaxID=5684 RepID=A0A0N1PC10_LEPSE|nr:hypothetical protein ABL78_6082 [Leptomonas seymouri]|eukprot:KPI84854.1 hypothetical protein ABL78_6082 [Leptomonas seymouri]